MKVNELVSMFDGITINSICAWNGRGNTPSKGFSFESTDELCEAYGDENVMSWKLECKCVGFVTLTVKMHGTEM